MDDALAIMKEATSEVEVIAATTAAGQKGDKGVQGFYEGGVVLITGGSGYMGKHLLEKLFRSCEIRKAYLLLRQKKGKSIEDRFSDILKDQAFDSLHTHQPDFKQRIVLVDGDVGQLRLGLSEENWRDITDNVSMIFHVAATVKFDETLKAAALTNVRGTREVLRLAKECQQLKSFVYVSTAYSQTIASRADAAILEQFYPVPVSPDFLIHMAETFPEHRIEEMTAKITHGWPNTYSFTKAVAEELVRTDGAGLPACIVRPAIVIGAYREPLPGWTDKRCIHGTAAGAPTETNSSECSGPNNIIYHGQGHDSTTSEYDIRLINNLNDGQVANLTQIQPSNSATSNTATASTPRKSFPNFDLETLLQTSAGGNSILKYYETYGFLDNSKRNQLTDIIIKHIYTYVVNCRIIYEEYNLIAAKIITLFPKESIGTYFTKPIKKINSVNGRSTIARGKLVDKVRNLLYKYGDRKRQTSDCENTPPPRKRNVDLQSLHSRDLIFLKTNTEPWDEVMQRWKNTFSVRKESEHQSVHEFLQDWKILSDPRSDILINIDFDLLYPEKGLNFYLNWNNFFQKLIILKPTRDDGIKNLLQSLENLEEDLKLPAQLKILAHLVPPKGRVSKKIKFTIQEAIESLYVCVPNVGDIEQVIAEQKQKATSKKLSVQPYIILQGSLLACSSPLLIVDDVRYQFPTIIKAFDTLFKLYHTFNVRYPRVGDHLYLIIQRCMYGIVTKYDNVVSYINDILSL